MLIGQNLLAINMNFSDFPDLKSNRVPTRTAGIPALWYWSFIGVKYSRGESYEFSSFLSNFANLTSMDDINRQVPIINIFFYLDYLNFYAL